MRQKLASYKPSLLDKLLGRSEASRQKFQDRLHDARAEDERSHQDQMKAYDEAVRAWQASRGFAQRMQQCDPRALLKFLQAKEPFSTISELGSELRFSFSDQCVLLIHLNVHGKEIIPDEEYVRLSSGKLSPRKLNKSRFFELYQDYVCGAMLRVARETFAVLPIEAVIVTAEDEVLNTSTGQMEVQPIVSSCIPRATLVGLSFDQVDPSDAMRNFVHNMSFAKTEGFRPVTIVRLPEKKRAG